MQKSVTSGPFPKLKIFQTSYVIGPSLATGLDSGHVTMTIKNGGPNLAFQASFLSITLSLALILALALALPPRSLPSLPSPS